MKERLERIYLRFRVQMRIIRLKLMYLREPEDALKPEEMLEEIKKKSKLT